MVLHNVACTYARLSQGDATRRVEHENLAISLLKRAAVVSRQNALGPDADELHKIHSETWFPQALRERPEFKRLIAELEDQG